MRRTKSLWPNCPDRKRPIGAERASHAVGTPGRSRSANSATGPQSAREYSRRKWSLSGSRARIGLVDEIEEARRRVLGLVGQVRRQHDRHLHVEVAAALALEAR